MFVACLCIWCIDLACSFDLFVLQKNVDEAVQKLHDRGIEVFGVVCHVSNAQQRKNLVDKTVQVCHLCILTLVQLIKFRSLSSYVWYIIYKILMNSFSLWSNWYNPKVLGTEICKCINLIGAWILDRKKLLVNETS